MPVLLTAVVVGWHVSRPQLWRDEYATWWAATRSPAALDRLTEHIDGVLEPYYRLLHLWIALFGDSVVSLRVPSVLAAVATAGLVAVLGTLLAGRWAGLLAGLVYAVLPSTIRYGQEARPYALGEFAALAATLLLFLALRRPRRRLWFAYAVALAVLGLLHLAMLLLFAGHLVAVLHHARTTRSWRSLLGPGVAVLAAVSMLVPLMLRGYTQTGTQLGTFHRTTLYLVAELPAGVCCGAVAAGALLVLAAAGALLGGGPGRVFGLLTLAPIAGLAVLGLFVPVFNHRYVLFVAPLACVLAGLALARLRLPLGLAVVVLLALITLPEQAEVRRSHEQTSAQLIDYRGAARVIAHDELPGDAIVYQRAGWQFVDIAMEYNLRHNTPRDILAATSRTAVGSFWTPQVTSPAAALAGVARVWEVVPDALSSHRPEVQLPPVRDALARAYRQTGRWRVSGITVLLFRRGSGSR
ncbi:glycosyltransferase family 39 protein [Plantactinospora siamensis]|uniref:Glycosyltransferase family 39 protein n=1 Tax=Plantactinospora siamensis TaxID=555372 RepID=A0ABV6P4E1_9ACTN